MRVADAETNSCRETEEKKLKTRQRPFILTSASGCEQIVASPEVQTPQRAPGPPGQRYLKPADLWLLDGGGGGGGPSGP